MENFTAKCDRIISEMGGLVKLQMVIPVTTDHVKEALAKGDVNLNNIPLSVWDKVAGRLVAGSSADYVGDFRLSPANWPAGLSLSERVCVLKRAAVRLATEEVVRW